MADGLTTQSATPATVPASTVIATDDAGAAGHVQVVKLAISTDGSATAIPAEATNGLDVDVTRVIPGTSATHLGKAEDAAAADGDTGVAMLGVRNYTGAGSDGDYSNFSVSATGEQRVFAHRQLTRISVASGGLTTTATAYTAGDQVGTQFTFANAARVSGGSGMIVGCSLVSAADTIGAFDVVITRASISLAADNAAYAISDADALHIVGLIQLVGAYDIGNNRVAQAFNLAVPYDCSGGTSLFANLISRAAIAATPFAAATDLQLTLWCELN